MGVTSPNVVVGGGGERSRRSRRKDGGAVEEALPLLPPPLLPPPPAKPELEPQGVSAPQHPHTASSRSLGREVLPPPAVAALGSRARPALRAPLPSSWSPMLAGAPTGTSPVREQGFGVAARAPPRPSCRGAFPAVKGGAGLPETRTPKRPGDQPKLSGLPPPRGSHVALQSDLSPAPGF